MRRFLFLLLAAALTAGCDNDILGGQEEEIAGNYDLFSIDGEQLPLTFMDTDSVQGEIVKAEILMGLNGVFREIDTFRFTRAAGVTTVVDTFTGPWTVAANNALTLSTQTTQGTLTLNGAWNGSNTMTFDVLGSSWVWRKR